MTFDDSKTYLENTNIFFNSSSLMFWSADNQTIPSQSIKIIKNVVDTKNAFIKGLITGIIISTQ